LDGWKERLGEHSPPWIRDCVPPRPHYALIDCCIGSHRIPESCPLFGEGGRKQYARGAQLVQLVYYWIVKSIPNPHLRT
jgi:hypothetical protein